MNQYQIAPESTEAKKVSEAFTPMLKEMEALEAEYNTLVGKPISKELCDGARTLRLKYVRIRTATAKTHKALKEGVLKFGRFLDGWKATQEQASGQIESRLAAIEDHYVEQERARLQAIQDDRARQLRDLEYPAIPENLATLDDLMWGHLLSGAQLALEAKRKAERDAAEAKRLAEEAERARREEEAKERERQRLENERLKAEAAERERVLAEERRRREESERKSREAAEKAERERIAELRRVEAEAADRQRIADAQAAAERKKAADAQAELDRMKREQEAKEMAAREAAEKEAAAQQKRDADKRHRKAVKAEVLAVISGMTPEQIIEAIEAGAVPHLSIRF